MILVSPCNCLCPIHWSVQVLSREWRCSWALIVSEWSSILLWCELCERFDGNIYPSGFNLWMPNYTYKRGLLYLIRFHFTPLSYIMLSCEIWNWICQMDIFRHRSSLCSSLVYFLISQIVFTFCTEHGSTTVVLCKSTKRLGGWNCEIQVKGNFGEVYIPTAPGWLRYGHVLPGEFIQLSAWLFRCGLENGPLGYI